MIPSIFPVGENILNTISLFIFFLFFFHYFFFHFLIIEADLDARVVIWVR